MSEINKTAIIGKNVSIGSDVSIGAYSIIEDNVIIGDKTIIDSHCVIKKDAELGSGNKLHSHVVIGDNPQDIGFDTNMKTNAVVGDNNVFREFVNIHRSTKIDIPTKVGNNTYIMVGGHVAHDAVVGNNVIMCNYTLVAGHVQIDNNVFISGNVAVHQFGKVGKYTLLSGPSNVLKDVPPFCIAGGEHGIFFKINLIGLRRAGFSKEEIKDIQNIYDEFYGRTKSSFLEKYDKASDMPSTTRDFVDFVKRSKRGICGKA